MTRKTTAKNGKHSIAFLVRMLRYSARMFALANGNDCAAMIVPLAYVKATRRSIRFTIPCRLKKEGPCIAASSAYAAATVMAAAVPSLSIVRRDITKERNSCINGEMTIEIRVEEQQKKGGAEWKTRT